MRSRVPLSQRICTTVLSIYYHSPDNCRHNNGNSYAYEHGTSYNTNCGKYCPVLVIGHHPLICPPNYRHPGYTLILFNMNTSIRQNLLNSILRPETKNNAAIGQLLFTLDVARKMHGIIQPQPYPEYIWIPHSWNTPIPGVFQPP